MVTSVSTKILMCLSVPKKLVVLACLTMSKLKMNRRVPNKNADLLKKNQLNGNSDGNCPELKPETFRCVISYRNYFAFIDINLQKP